MSTFLFFAILALVFIGVPIGLGMLFYFVPKKLGYPKVAKYLTRCYVLSILILLFFIVFEDQLFTKNEARKLVEEQNIRLNDKFSLLNNSSTSAPGDYYHTFTLKMSAADRQQAIADIKGSRTFKTDPHLVDSLLYIRNEGRYFGPRVVQEYETEHAYVREYFQPSGKQGYAPTFRRISISKTENELTFEDIDE